MKYLIVCLLVFSACATTEKYKERCAPWVGESEENLIAHWGVPSNQYDTASARMIQYISDGGTTASQAPFSGMGNSAPIYNITNHSCQTTFTIMNGKVTNYSFQGNSCRSK